jgi:Tfp pilus assembly protein PilO
MIKLPKLDNLRAFLGHLSKREKLVLYGAVAFVALAFFDRMILGTFSAKIQSLDKEISEKESQIKKSLRILSQRQRIEIQRANLSSYLGREKDENEEFTLFLKEVENLANKAGIYLIDMKPAGSKDMGDYKKYSVNLNCEGQMETISKFMHQVENYGKLLSIEKYQLAPKSAESSIAKCSMVITKLVMP